MPHWDRSGLPSLKYQYVFVATLFLLTLGQWRRDAGRVEVLVTELRSQLAAEMAKKEVAQMSSVALEAIALQRENDLFKLRRAGFGASAKAAVPLSEDLGRRVRTKNGVDLKMYANLPAACPVSHCFERPLQAALHSLPRHPGSDCLSHTWSVARPSLAHRYVYELPADFNTNMLDPSLQTMFHCRDSMYGAEVIIHEQLLLRYVQNRPTPHTCIRAGPARCIAPSPV